MKIKRLVAVFLGTAIIAGAFGPAFAQPDTGPLLLTEPVQTEAAVSDEMIPETEAVADDEPTKTPVNDSKMQEPVDLKMPEAVIDTAPAANGFKDRNRMSDEEFFGAWHEDTQTWYPEPKLDYSYADELRIVENYVKKGDWYNAKEALTHYYQNRPLAMALPTGRSPLEARISMEGIHTFESPAVALWSVGTVPSEYKADVTSLVANNVSCFLIQSLKRESLNNNEEEIVSFHSKESKDHPPVLEVWQGKTVTELPVNQDMYIRGGDFSGENYGKEPELLVSEGGEAPVGNGTRQTHVRFDLSSLDLSQKITGATLKLYGSSTAPDKEVVVFSGVESGWDEGTITYATLPIRVMSWNNVEDGYDWAQRNGAHGQFYNVQIRLLHIPRMFAEYFATKDERYANAAIKQYLDFIGDNGGLLYDNYPKEAALNAGFRGDPYSVSAFYGALACDGIIDGTAAVSILKFIWQEATGLAMSKNEWRKHNGQAFQIDSLLRYIAYFPEFRDRNDWVERIDRRVLELAEDLLYEDGGYIESTSGYDSGVLNTLTGLFSLADIAGLELPEAFMEYYRKFGTAEMNLTMPNGVQWGWGDGGPVQMRSRIQAVADLTGDREMEYFATIGSGDQKGTMPAYTSYYLPASKMGVMRNNWNENGIAAFLRGRAGGGHSHASVNHMSMYAYGRYLLADTGMNSYDQRDPNYTWQFLRTESHNTVEINATGQQKSGIVNTEMFTNPRMDFFTGESHAYLDFIHTRKISFVKNSKYFIVSDYIQAPEDGNVNLFNQTWHNLVEAKPTLNETNKIAKTTYSSGANLEIVPVAPETLTSATLDDGVGLSESNSVRNTAQKKHVSYKIQKAGNAKFNTVIYPFEGSVQTEIPATPLAVSDCADESASAFSMTLPDQTKALYYVNFKPEKIHRFDWYDVDGETVYMELDKNNTLKFFSGANINYIRQNGANLMSSSKKLSDISVSFEGKVANIQTTQAFDLTRDYIRMYAPTAVKATFNNEEVPFLRMGDDVVIGRCHLELTPQLQADGTCAATLSEAVSVSYPLTVSGTKQWICVEMASGTRLTGDSSWDGIVNFDPMQTTTYQAGKQTFGRIPFVHLKTDLPVRIFFDGQPGWRAAVVKEGRLILADTKLAEDTYEGASGMVTAEKPGYYQSGSSSSTYVNDLQDYILYAESTIINHDKPGGNVGGISGGGGGNHIWPSNPSIPDIPQTSPSPTPGPDFGSCPFTDITGHWAEADIQRMYTLGFVNGVTEELFMPENNITRGEFTAMITRMLKLEQSAYEGRFADVPAAAWYAGSVEAAAKAGIINGTGDGFEPDAPIRRGEMAKILNSAWKYLNLTAPAPLPDKISWTDQAQFSPWEQEAIIFAAGAGLMNGMPDGAFCNLDYATRAEAVTVLKRLYDSANKGESE